MSTRCQLGIYPKQGTPIKDFETLIYRHSDGYPSGVLPDIMPFLVHFKTNRGLDDIEYATARLIQYMTNQSDESHREWQKQWMKENPQEIKKNYEKALEMKKTQKFGNVTGFGISNALHGDIEYFYYISQETVIVYTMDIWHGINNPASNINQIGTIPITLDWETDPTYLKLIQNH